MEIQIDFNLENTGILEIRTYSDFENQNIQRAARNLCVGLWVSGCVSNEILCKQLELRLWMLRDKKK